MVAMVPTARVWCRQEGEYPVFSLSSFRLTPGNEGPHIAGWERPSASHC